MEWGKPPRGKDWSLSVSRSSAGHSPLVRDSPRGSAPLRQSFSVVGRVFGRETAANFEQLGLVSANKLSLALTWYWT